MTPRQVKDAVNLLSLRENLNDTKNEERFVVCFNELSRLSRAEESTGIEVKKIIKNMENHYKKMFIRDVYELTDQCISIVDKKLKDFGIEIEEEL